MNRRVVITGAGGICALGQNWEEVSRSLKACKNAVRHMPEWEKYRDLNTRLASPVENFVLPAHYTRRKTRAMGRNAKMAVRASELALEMAGLIGDPQLGEGRVGVAYGSSTGSTDASADFVNMLTHHSMDGINATTYVRLMSHTAAVNIGVYFGLKGRVVPTSSACTSGSQGVGFAYETIRGGAQDIMLAGGSEELCPTEAAVFDVLYATSTRNDQPSTSPRPFDRDRDGLVIGEGACTLILEEREHALARGAHIMGEIVGFGTNSDGAHVTHPNQETMARAMSLSLESAGLPASEIGYVNAHGTATEAGDIAETTATHQVLGGKPISSMKSYIGHTLGPCGALEAWVTMQMMNEGWVAPTVNLENVDPRCGDLDYIMAAPRPLTTEYAMSNNFAFGGINTSLILRQHP